jgi:hypothetical protein
MPIVNGTPVNVQRADNEVIVLFSVGDSSDSMTFSCENAEEAHDCFDMWEMLVDNACDYPVNAEADIYEEDDD